MPRCVHGRGGIGPADRMYQYCESLGGPNGGSRSGIILRSALGASHARLAAAVACRVSVPVICRRSRRVAGGLLDNFACSQGSASAARGKVYSLLDGRVLAFTLTMSLVTPLMFGLLPMLYIRRIHVFPTQTSSATRGSRRVRESLVVAQVMLTVILLAGSVSLGRAFIQLMRIDRGYDVNGVVTVSVSLDGTTHQMKKAAATLF